MTTASVSEVNRTPRRWPWFIVGVLLFLLGPILAYVQFNLLEILTTPWQLPILGTLGVIFMLLSVLQRGGVLRIVGLVLFTVFVGFEWIMLVVGMATPLYTGPANPGSPLPVFAAKRADGQPITNADFALEKSSVMLFFRGRW